MTNLTDHSSAQSKPSQVAMNTCPSSYSTDGLDLHPCIHSDVSVSSKDHECPARPGTPVVLRAGGIRLPHNHSPKDLHDLAKLLNIDIRASSDTYISNLVDLLSVQLGIFLDSKLPIIPSQDLLCQISLYDTHQQRW